MKKSQARQTSTCGSGAMVMTEAGLDGIIQFEAIRAYLRGR